MAKDDYFVIVYRILSYLYECLKQGSPVSFEYLQPGTDAFPVGNSYWEYIWRQLYNENYIEGIYLVPILGDKTKGVKLTSDVMITPKGIEFLQNNSAMSKAKDFLKGLKEIIPGI